MLGARAPSNSSMDRWKGKVALVTGASTGIGYETAKQLVLSGMTVVGCARNTAKIEALSSELSGKLVAIKCDLSKEEEILSMFEQIKSQLGGVDVLVNNAGLAHHAPLLSGETSLWREMMEVNVIAVCVCTREFMKQAKQRGVDDGHIILLNSMAGHRVISTGAASDTHFYSATKFAITGITEGIRQELRAMNSGIKVTGISPGLVRTEFRPRLVKADDVEAARKDYDTLVQWPLESEDIVSTIIYCLSTPPRMQIHDIQLRPTHQVL